MTSTQLPRPAEWPMFLARGGLRLLRSVGLILALAWLPGCGGDNPLAMVEGVLRLEGRPLDNCLVTFLPEPGNHTAARQFTGLTDQQGRYRLHGEDQQEGVAIGWHRVTILDLSVSTGIRRVDHGTVDAETTDTVPPRRNSRVPERYTSPTSTPWRMEVRPGSQVIDLEIVTTN